MLLICFCFVSFDCCSVSIDSIFVSFDCCAVCFDGSILCFVFVVLSVQLLLNFCSVAVDFSVQKLVVFNASLTFCIDFGVQCEFTKFTICSFFVNFVVQQFVACYTSFAFCVNFDV